MRALWSLLFVIGCGGAVPQTHFYTLVVPPRAPAPATGHALSIDLLTADAAYDNDRIAYRKSPYRIDYYQYHRWSALPSHEVADYLREALTRSGRFREVALGPLPSATAVLAARILAFEEVERGTRSLGHVALELSLRDARTTRLLWSRREVEWEPMAARTPEALARALSTALDRLVRRIEAPIADAMTAAAQSAAMGDPAGLP